MWGFYGAHFLFVVLVLIFVRSVAFLEALVLLGLPLLKFTQLALLFGFGLLAPLIFVAPCTLPFMRFVLSLAPVDC